MRHTVGPAAVMSSVVLVTASTGMPEATATGSASAATPESVGPITAPTRVPVKAIIWLRPISLFDWSSARMSRARGDPPVPLCAAASDAPRAWDTPYWEADPVIEASDPATTTGVVTVDAPARAMVLATRGTVSVRAMRVRRMKPPRGFR